MKTRPRLSIVIPAYNESARILASLDTVARFLSGTGEPAEIVVVDDGSKDTTAEASERFGRERKDAGDVAVRVLRNGQNRGKGYSVKHGVLLSAGDLVLISDADFSTPIEELPRLKRILEGEGCDVVIGSRGLADSRVEVRQAAGREMLGRGFNVLVRLMTGLPFKDTQCGFKLMRRQEVLPLFRAARIERFAWDVEILYLARKAGLAVREVPVIWRNAAGTKVSALTDPLDMLKDVLRIVLRDRLGRYGRIGAEPAGAHPAR